MFEQLHTSQIQGSCAVSVPHVSCHKYFKLCSWYSVREI